MTKIVKIIDFNVVSREEKMIEGTVQKVEVYDNIANVNKEIKDIVNNLNNLVASWNNRSF